MKRLRYKLRTLTVDPITGTEKEVFTVVTVPDDDAGRALAEEEAYGEVESFDDGQPALQPSQLDVIEAQVAYTAMMTDTLLEV